MVSIYLLSSSTTGTSTVWIDTMIGKLDPTQHMLLVYFLPELIAFGCTAFVLHSGKYFKDAKYVAGISRGENRWKEVLDEQFVINIQEKQRNVDDRVRCKSDHDLYKLEQEEQENKNKPEQIEDRSKRRQLLVKYLDKSDPDREMK